MNTKILDSIIWNRPNLTLEDKKKILQRDINDCNDFLNEPIFELCEECIIICKNKKSFLEHALEELIFLENSLN